MYEGLILHFDQLHQKKENGKERLDVMQGGKCKDLTLKTHDWRK
jgi:hypothetical protein